MSRFRPNVHMFQNVQGDKYLKSAIVCGEGKAQNSSVLKAELTMSSLSQKRQKASREKIAKGFLQRKTHLSAPFLGTVAVGVLSIFASFGLGVRSAGELRTLERSEAAKEAASIIENLKGDTDGNGILTMQDVIIDLEIAQGLRAPTRDEALRGDMNGDLKLTVLDALAIAHAIADR